MLTGRTAIRINWRGQIILQVEDRVSEYYGSCDITHYNIYRDAKIEDLRDLNILSLDIKELRKNASNS